MKRSSLGLSYPGHTRGSSRGPTSPADARPPAARATHLGQGPKEPREGGKGGASYGGAAPTGLSGPQLEPPLWLGYQTFKCQRTLQSDSILEPKLLVGLPNLDEYFLELGPTKSCRKMMPYWLAPLHL